MTTLGQSLSPLALNSRARLIFTGLLIAAGAAVAIRPLGLFIFIDRRGAHRAAFIVAIAAVLAVTPIDALALRASVERVRPVGSDPELRLSPPPWWHDRLGGFVRGQIRAI